MTDISTEFSIKDVGTKVGLEIHQQLATGKKLFCNCTPIESDEYTSNFTRKLRASKSELGEFDSAVLFESIKSKTMMYYANTQSSCLVESDEEPPHELDSDAKNTALIVSCALKSQIFDEIYPMRKTVIDGSNTTGFQRTMLISQGGFFKVDQMEIGVQSICLEEDAAKILGEKNSVKQYSLERLGIPLIEIATEPFLAEPLQVRKIAQSLGRILKSTKKTKRGLGSIRQDVNVSINDGGVVIEVKGVQQLEQLDKVVEYEAKRQHGLLQISKKLKEKNWSYIQARDKKDVTELFLKCSSKIVANAIKNDQKIIAVAFRNLAGIFGYLPYEEIRLGKEVAELVRFFGIGGIFHSDELPNYGIETSHIKSLEKFLEITPNDAFLIIAAPQENIHNIIDQTISRIKYIKDNGIPADTRVATKSGQTKFLRPRPGSARMYPETDIPPIIITKQQRLEAQMNVPEPWHESIKRLQAKYEINQQLAEQIFDSKYFALFEKIIEKTKTDPTFVVSILCSMITNLERSGLDSHLLADSEIFTSFELLEEKKIAKESIEIIFQDIMSAKSKTVEQAIKNTLIDSIDDAKLENIIKDIVDKNQEIIQNQKERAAGPLMGMIMKELRGKASGQTINAILLKHIKKKLENAGDGI